MGLLSIRAIVQCYVYSFALRLVGDPEAIHMSEKSAVVRTADRIENAWSACGGNPAGAIAAGHRGGSSNTAASQFYGVVFS
jgi:hypothetical protein